MVYYRKYRPQKIEELDEEKVRNTLGAVLLSKKSNFHAFLFTGPKGLGKTSAARIVAKFLNCERRKPGELEPCNKCYQCSSITNGTNLDILEIDAASNRGIDEIRALREKINLSTIKAKYKVYIIDEVHMLTTEAFNALLKTLEEPPSHAVFVLCTTDPQKVPATIVSRCLHVPFSLATSEELVRSLKRIVKGEDLKVGDGVLNMIADLSDGSFRDGSKILQEVSAKAGSRKITKEFLDNFFHSSSIEKNTRDIREFLYNKNAKGALQLVSDLNKEGLDVKYFLEQLIEDLHGELLLEVMGTDGNKELIFSVQDLKKLLNLLTTAHQEIKYAVIPSLPLELAIVEYCLDESLRAVSAPVRQAASASVEASATSTGTTSHLEFLQELILKVNSENKMIAGLLRGVILQELDGKKITFETKSKFHKEKLSEGKIRDLIEKVSSEILKKNVRIDIRLKGGEGR